MNEAVAGGRGARRRGARPGASEAGPSRSEAYRKLRNPFVPQTVFSQDRIEAIHDTALRVLEELGIKVLLPEARERFAAAGALVDPETGIVRIGRDIVLESLAVAPRSFLAKAGDSSRDQIMETGTLTFIAGSGTPNVTDIGRGRRAGSFEDYENLIKLAQSFHVLHGLAPHTEPQDIPPHLRHYAMMKSQLTLSDKFPFVYARGTPQVLDSFEMIRLARGLSAAEFESTAYCYTVINTNSPRQLDIPMAQGIIDFAKAGQISIITPFCLAGAMAPITVAGALTLQHAEAMAGITLAQITRKGAPVVYGSFSSNVDMKSGAPAFGTPEHFKATLGSGQLARFLGLPWRGGGGSAANISDAQAANETQMALWGAVLGGATVLIHSAGWLEGGLSFSYEKMITDLEVLQSVAELCVATPADADAIGFDAIAEVNPGGHFFATGQTMARYRNAFYEPLVADLSNFGNWTEAGSKTATERAHGIWQKILKDFKAPMSAAGIAEILDPFIATRTAEGGAGTVS
ncbi:MAG TPA: trimethylamine methyltransferase family protein [Dongiaceae bacterium]|jgi:trimethylamine--corrinoid protein Co-methyltransferase